jgi:hypothetical protein
VTVGPFSYLRPGTRLARGAKVGAFVETKNVDVGATDGAANSFFGGAGSGVHRFFGTSAAAPHAAAVAALEIQARPCRTPAEVIKAQRDGAVSIGLPEATGAGRLDAVGAINQLAVCPATHFSVSAPADATVGVPASVTVTALDANNHTAIGYSGLAHFTSGDGAAVLPANTALTLGVGHVQVTFNTLGNQTVTATDTVTSSVNGTSGVVAVANKFGYHPVTPARILESRPGFNPLQFSTPWTPGLDRQVQVRGLGGVPSSASAVALNVTAVNATQASDLRIYPTGQTRPNASSLNFSAGEVIPNAVIARIGSGGSIRIFNNAGNVDVIADVVGWFDDGTSAGDLYTAVTPKRILESRPGFGPLQYSTPWNGGTDRPVVVTGGSTTVPAEATAVVLNVTAVNPTAGSDLRVYPTGQVRPNSSSLNFVAGEVIPNLVIATVGTGGSIQIFNETGNVDVIADVLGYFRPAVSGGGPYHPLAPSRVLESRAGFGPIQYSTPWNGGTDRAVQISGFLPSAVVPPNATAVVLNVIAVNPSGGSDLRVYPTGQPRPNASNLNFVAGETVPNLAVVALGTGGKIQIFNESGNVDVIADVVGYFT